MTRRSCLRLKNTYNSIRSNESELIAKVKYIFFNLKKINRLSTVKALNGLEIVVEKLCEKESRIFDEVC